jgi:hypothetical protein
MEKLHKIGNREFISQALKQPGDRATPASFSE